MTNREGLEFAKRRWNEISDQLPTATMADHRILRGQQTQLAKAIGVLTSAQDPQLARGRNTAPPLAFLEMLRRNENAPPRTGSGNESWEHQPIEF